MPRSNSNNRLNVAKVGNGNSSKSAFVPIQSPTGKTTTAPTDSALALTPSSNKPPRSGAPSPPTKGSSVNSALSPSPRTQNISPQAVRNLSKSPEMSGALATSPRGVNGKPLLPAEVSKLLGRVGETIGQGLFTVGSTVTAQATDVAFTVGNVVGDQTEMLMNQAVGTLPKYSENDVRQIMAKKDMLLNELSRTCLLLGIAEENKSELERQTESLRQREVSLEEFTRQQAAQIEELEQELLSIREEKDALLSRFETIRAEDLTELDEWRASAADQKEQCNRLLEQFAAAEAQLATVRLELERERLLYAEEKSVWEQQMQELGESQIATRHEMEATFKNAMTQLVETEQQRDKLSAELEVLREVSTADKVRMESENAKFKEALAVQQTASQQRLEEKDAELQASRKEATDWKLKADEFSTQVFALMREKSDLEVKLTSADSNLNLSQVSYSLLEREVKEVRNNLMHTQKDLEEERKIRLGQIQKIQELEIENRFQVNKVKDLQEQLSLSGSKSAEFISDFQHKYEQKCHEIRDLETKIAQTERMIRDGELKYENSLQMWQQSMDLKEKDFQVHLQEVQVSHRGELESLRVKLQLSSEQLAAREKEITKLTSALDSQKHQVESTSNQAGVLKDQYLKEIATLHAEIEQHRAQVSEKDRTIDLLQARVSQVVSESSATVGHQSALVSSLQAELLASKQSLDQVLKAHQTSRTETLSKLNAKSFEHLEIISKLRAELLALRSDYNEVVSTQQSIVKTAGQMQDLMRRSSEEESARTKGGFSLAQAEKEALVHRASSLEQSLADMENRCLIMMTKERESELTIQTLKSELQLAQSVSSQQTTSLQDKIANMTAKLQEMESIASIEKVALASLETEKIKLNQRVIDQQADLDECRRKEAELQAEINSIHAQYLHAVQSHSEAVATLTSQVHSDTESSVTLRLSSEYEVKLQLLKSELASWKERASTFEQSSRDAQSKFAQASVDLKQNYEAKIAELIQKFDQTSENHVNDRANLVASYERKLDELRKSSSDAAMQLQEAMSNHGSEQVKIYQTKVRELQDELEKVQRASGDERRAWEQAQTQAKMNASMLASDLQNQLAALRLELDTTRATLVAAEREKEWLHTANTSQTQESTSSQAADKQRIVQLEGQLLVSNQTVASLEDALRLSNDQKSSLAASIRDEQHSLDEKVSDLLKSNQSLTKQLHDLNQAYEVLKASSSSSLPSEWVESLRQQHDQELTTVKAEGSRKIESLEQDNRRMNDSLQDIESKYNSLLAATSSSSTQDAVIADLHARLVLEKKSFDASAAQTKAEYETTVNRLTKEIELTRQRSSEESEREASQLKEQLLHQKTHLESVEAHLALISKEKLILEQRVTELSAALARPTASNAQSQTPSNLEAEQLAVVKQQVVTVTAERDSLLMALNSKTKELDFNLSQMSNLKETVLLLEADYQTLEKQRDEMVLVMEAQNSALEQAETRTKEQSTNKHKIDGLIATTEDRYRDLLKSAIAAEKVAVHNAKALQEELKSATEALLTERHKQGEAEATYKQEVEELRQHVLEMEELLVAAEKENLGGGNIASDTSHLGQGWQQIRDREMSVVWHEKLVRLIAELRDAVTVASIDAASSAQTGSGDSSHLVSPHNGSSTSNRSAEQWERWETINRLLHSLRLHVVSVIPGVDVTLQSSSINIERENQPVQAQSSPFQQPQKYTTHHNSQVSPSSTMDPSTRKAVVKGIVQAWKKTKASLSNLGQNISPSSQVHALSPSAQSSSAESYTSLEPLDIRGSYGHSVVSPTTRDSFVGQPSWQQQQQQPIAYPAQYYGGAYSSEPTSYRYPTVMPNAPFYIGPEESFGTRYSDSDPFLLLAHATDAALPGGSSALSKYMQQQAQLRYANQIPPTTTITSSKLSKAKSQVRRVPEAVPGSSSKHTRASSVPRVSPSAPKSRASSRAVSPMSRVSR